MVIAKPQTQWMTASPLWPALAETPEALRRPALLRFTADTFMEDFQKLLHSEPQRLSEYMARKESFRSRPAGAPASPPQTPFLKLYQPAHGHFSLVAANLVCRTPGLPDHSVNVAAKEKAAFLLRRIAPAGEEMAWVEQNGRKLWLSLTSAQAGGIALGEEQLPLFPLSYTQGAARRRLLAGLVPTSSRETLQAAPAISPIDPVGDSDPRADEVRQRVLDPWSQLKKSGAALSLSQRVEISRFVLLDFADFLASRLPSFWNALVTQSTPSGGVALYSKLTTLAVQRTPSGTMVLREALMKAIQEWDRISGESAELPALSVDLAASFDPAAVGLAGALTTAIAEIPATQARGPVPEVPKLDSSGAIAYVIRCTYQQPGCLLHGAVVSPPSEPFVLAAFFDPDAPARTIRIELPVDTSLAGLRKFKSNVAFLVSDKLRRQMQTVNDATSALKGEMGAEGTFNLGELCSFSIPIITLCAFMVLMIFISLLNIVFWWLPLLRLCFPLKLKAK